MPAGGGHGEARAALTPARSAVRPPPPLQDGGWPPLPDSQWMKREQEEAIEAWVLGGGALMPLHNSLWAIPGWTEEHSAALVRPRDAIPFVTGAQPRPPNCACPGRQLTELSAAFKCLASLRISITQESHMAAYLCCAALRRCAVRV
eukprot:SAG11_NODE_1543_length_4716_cov_6.357375_4_plen_147_part_00